MFKKYRLRQPDVTAMTVAAFVQYLNSNETREIPKIVIETLTKNQIHIKDDCIVLLHLGVSFPISNDHFIIFSEKSGVHIMEANAFRSTYTEVELYSHTG